MSHWGGKVYRLTIDFEMGDDLESATECAEHIIEQVQGVTPPEGMKGSFNVRLTHDQDRGNKNYLDINENGHCTNKKLVKEFTL